MGAEDMGTVDFVVVAYREEGQWQVSPVSHQCADDLATLLWTLRRQPADAGALGLVSVDDDFFVLARVLGQANRVLLSDVTAASEWSLAREALEEIDPDGEGADEDDEPEPAGDLSIVADLGVSALDIGFICDDLDLYPEDMLASIADRLGFGEGFRQAVEAGAV